MIWLFIRSSQHLFMIYVMSYIGLLVIILELMKLPSNFCLVWSTCKSIEASRWITSLSPYELWHIGLHFYPCYKIEDIAPLVVYLQNGFFQKWKTLLFACVVIVFVQQFLLTASLLLQKETFYTGRMVMLQEGFWDPATLSPDHRIL